MREEDLLDFVWIADPQVSPEGKAIAYTRVEVDRKEDTYRTSLWWVATSGGEPRPLTNGPSDGQPRWSSDGRRIAFVRKPEGDAPPQIHVLPMDGGEPSALTALAKGASSPAWSPDGARIAFTSDTNPGLDGATDEKGQTPAKPKHEPARIVTKVMFRENNVGFYDFEHLQHVWVVESAGGTPRQLTHGKYAEGAPKWSRDGKFLMFVSDRRDEPWFGVDESHVWAVAVALDAPTDSPALVTGARGPVTAFSEASDGRLATIGAVLSDTPNSCSSNPARGR